MDTTQKWSKPQRRKPIWDEVAYLYKVVRLWICYAIECHMKTEEEWSNFVNIDRLGKTAIIGQIGHLKKERGNSGRLPVAQGATGFLL